MRSSKSSSLTRRSRCYLSYEAAEKGNSSKRKIEIPIPEEIRSSPAVRDYIQRIVEKKNPKEGISPSSCSSRVIDSRVLLSLQTQGMIRKGRLKQFFLWNMVQTCVVRIYGCDSTKILD